MNTPSDQIYNSTEPADAICLEYDHPDPYSLKLLKETKAKNPSLPVIIITEQHSESLAIWSFRSGAWDYLVSPMADDDVTAFIRSLHELKAKRIANYQGGNRDAVKHASQECEQTKLNNNLSDESLLHPAIEYVERNYEQKIVELEVAERCNMSLFRFSRLFKRTFALTFQEYLLQLRMNKALQLLQNPHTPISAIAYTVGFNDPSYFTRIFKRFTGTSPTTYRNDAISRPTESALAANSFASL